MKTILVIVVVGGVCLLAGLFFGARVGRHQEITEIANSYTEAAEALNIASELFVDVRIADYLHKDQVNDALHLIVERIDADIVRLASRQTVAQANGQSEILYETNTISALNFGLAYR